MTHSSPACPTAAHHSVSLSSDALGLSASVTAKRWLYAAACLTVATVASGAEAAWAEGITPESEDASEAVSTAAAIASPVSQVLSTAPPEAIYLTGRGALEPLKISQETAPPNPASNPASDIAEPTEESRSEAFGTRGSDRWYIQAGAATTFDNEFALAGAGISHFFAKGHSINAELNGMAFSQDGDDAVGANLNLLLRYHFVRQENWSLYIDGGAGILGTTDNVPSGGSSFNFTPQAGGGATIRLSDEERLMVGLRWHHISNANTFDSNPGRDSVMGYVGLNLPR